MAATPTSPRPREQAWRRLVLEFIEKHRAQIVHDLAAMIRIPSISGSDAENEIQHLLSARLEGIGLDVDRWQIPLTRTLAEPDFPGVEVDRTEGWGVVGRLAGSGNGPTLMLNAHVDVVPPGHQDAWQGHDPFDGAITADAVHGRGACDMKAGLVASLWAARALQELQVPLSGDLLVATVIGEEDGGLGTYALLKRGWRADACVIPEPTSLDIAPASCGALTFEITVHGAATHASRRLDGISAVEMFIPIFQAVRRLEHKRNRTKHPLAARWELPVPIEIGRVLAGDWASSVPDLLRADGRLGVAIDEDIPTARKALETAVALACDDDPWLRRHPASIRWWGGQFASALTSTDSPIVSTVAAAHAEVSAQPQNLWATPYGSDLRLLHGLGRIPTIHYGPGDASLAHGPRESVPIYELVTATQTLAMTALGHCGLS
jgi:acetylornithine deacetylase